MVTGVTFTAGDDAAPVPAAFVAVTVMAYCVPFVRPVTMRGLVVPVTEIAAPGLGGVAVTVYEVIVLPPFDAGGEKLTVACPLLAVAETLCGASGTVRGVATTVAIDPAPAGVVTTLTAKVYAVPFVRPGNV